MWRIFDMLFPPREDDIALRSISDDAFLGLMSPRLVAVTEPQAVALFPFAEPPVRAAIHEAKYHGSERAFRLLSRALSDYLRDAEEGFGNPILVPVPLGNARRKERLFNQVEEVARLATKELGIAIDTDRLMRVRETASQVSLPRRERRENMRGAFRADHAAEPDRTYIIIDDVTTTGATLQACIDALIDSGARNIIPLALAH